MRDVIGFMIENVIGSLPYAVIPLGIFYLLVREKKSIWRYEGVRYGISMIIVFISSVIGYSGHSELNIVAYLLLFIGSVFFTIIMYALSSIYYMVSGSPRYVIEKDQSKEDKFIIVNSKLNDNTYKNKTEDRLQTIQESRNDIELHESQINDTTDIEQRTTVSAKTFSEGQLIKKRFIRFWVLILLPLASFFGYFAYESHMSQIVHQEYASDWLENLHRDPNSKIESLFSKQEMKEMFDKEIQWREEEQNKRLIYSILSGILLSFPALIWFVLRAYRWVWFGT